MVKGASKTKERQISKMAGNSSIKRPMTGTKECRSEEDSSKLRTTCSAKPSRAQTIDGHGDIWVSELLLWFRRMQTAACTVPWNGQPGSRACAYQGPSFVANGDVFFALSYCKGNGNGLVVTKPDSSG